MNTSLTCILLDCSMYLQASPILRNINMGTICYLLMYVYKRKVHWLTKSYLIVLAYNVQNCTAKNSHGEWKPLLWEKKYVNYIIYIDPFGPSFSIHLICSGLLIWPFQHMVKVLNIWVPITDEGRQPWFPPSSCLLTEGVASTHGLTGHWGGMGCGATRIFFGLVPPQAPCHPSAIYQGGVSPSQGSKDQWIIV